MDLRKLKTLIDLVADSDIAELEVTEGEGKVRIVKSFPQQLHYASPQIVQQAPAPAPVAEAPAAPPPPAIPAAPTGNIVKSPMVGTFYRAPAPGKPSYIELGSVVKVADPVCIIEAMKLLNEIEAGFDGVIKEVLVENGQAVEFGQPLFVIA
jgi:acetyl-CoA carboxylase biotin carboxyl carrier protein